MRLRWKIPGLGVATLLCAGAAPAQVAPGDLLVTSIATGEIYRLDPDALVPMDPIPVATGGAFAVPRGLAVDRNGLLLVADDGSKTLWRVDPGRGVRALVAQFSVVSSALRGTVAASDGRIFVADPGLVPLVEPPLPALRGITYFPAITELEVSDGLTIGSTAGGCLANFLLPGTAFCGNLYLPTGVAIASDDSELVILVADGGWPVGSARERQGVIQVFPDGPLSPPPISDPQDPPYPAVTEEIGGETFHVNDELFCVEGVFATPRSLAIDRSDGSVLVTDSGNAAAGIPARVLRVPATGCCDPESGICDPAQVRLVAEADGLVRPIGIAVADDGTIFVADATADTVFRIDPNQSPPGNVHPLSIPGSIDQAWALAIQSAAPRPYAVADAGVPELLAVDPAAPSRTTVTSGGALVAPAALELLPADAGFAVADPSAVAVIEIAASGAQTVISQGGRLVAPISASREADGRYLVTDQGDPAAMPAIPPAVIRVDPALPSPGNQTVVSEGGLLVRPVAGAIDGGGFLIAVDAGDGSGDPPPAIVRISPQAGLGPQGQEQLFAGPPLVAPAAIALDEGGGVIVVADRGDATVPPSVVRLVRSSEPPGAVAFAFTLASGDLLETPAGIAIDADRSILVSDGGDPAIAGDGAVIRVDAFQFGGLLALQSPVATAGSLDRPTGIAVQAPAAGPFVDQDGDGITDAEDNCISVPNSDQRDTDVGDPGLPEGDRIGNVCDGDYDDDGVVGNSDFNALRRAFLSMEGDPRYDPDIDADGDGSIGNDEFNLLRDCFSKVPGQSGRLGVIANPATCKPSATAP